MFVCKLAHNRIFRLVTVLLMIFVFMLVPTENRLQDAKTAYAVAIADDAVIAVVVGVLVGMGLWNAYKGVTTSDSKPFDNGAMRALAKKCIDNIPELYRWGLTVATGVDVKALINVPKAIYKLIKDYLDSTYDDVSSVQSDVECVSVPGTILCKGCYTYPKSYIMSNPGLAFGLHSYTTFWNTWSISSREIGYSENTECFTVDFSITRLSDGYVMSNRPLFKNFYKLDFACIAVYDDENLSLNSGNNTGSISPCSIYVVYKKPDGVGVGGLLNNTSVGFSSTDEFMSAQQIITGDNGLRIDKGVYNSEYAPYIKYYQDINSYMDATAADITCINAKLDGLASNVVNTATQTIHWTGGITDCPIDNLKSQLEDLVTSAPAIGDWTCSWDKSGTLCDISVTDISTGEKVADISGDVAISWTDVATEIGVSTDSKTDTDVDTDTKTDTTTGDLTMPDDKTKIDWKPLQLAGELFTTRFPFSLPWDLYKAFTLFEVSDGKAPVISLPINLGEYGDYSVDIDLTVFDDNVVIVVRWTTYVGFLIALVILTNKLIGRG